MQLIHRYALAARDRARRGMKKRLLRFAPTIRCERCGEPLFKAYPVVEGGSLHLFGAEEITVSAHWSSKRTLRFRHEGLDLCARDERPPFKHVNELGRHPDA